MHVYQESISSLQYYTFCITILLCKCLFSYLAHTTLQALSKNGKVFGNGIMVGVQRCIDKVRDRVPPTHISSCLGNLLVSLLCTSHALGTSSCHSRVPISHWSVCYRRAHHVGQHYWGHQASHAHLWWTETGIHQTPYSSISSRQCLAPGWGSIVFPPSPSPPPPILLRHFNLCLSLRLCRPIPILHRKAPVYFQRRLNTYLDGEDCIPSISSSCLSVSVCYVPPCTLAVTCFCPLREEDEIDSICTLNMIYQYCCKYIVFLEMTLYL